MSITVMAHWTAREGREEDIERFLAEITEKSLAEPGCLAYRSFRSLENGREFALFEEYSDADALAHHKASAHYRELVLERVVPLLVKRHVGRYGTLRAV
ncbi:putative quinol monooxygenase [Streptomyces sp. DT24]|nr:putative quinol monooxygenase [Streptomyces sp. AM 4-1-1]WEH34832.1 putative quinol monooxygenase [Streptomyces sp. AM 4-1-1]